MNARLESILKANWSAALQPDGENEDLRNLPGRWLAPPSCNSLFLTFVLWFHSVRNFPRLFISLTELSCTVWLTMLALPFASLAQVSTEFVYENNKNFLDSFYASPLEFGDEIKLKNEVPWKIADFGFDYFGDFAATGQEKVVLRLYKNDGPDTDPGSKFIPAPGTLIFESDPLTIESGYHEALFSGLSLDVPGVLTWTVKFSGLTGAKGNQAGLLFENPPTVGFSFDDYWQRADSGWQLVRFGGNPVANFGSRVRAFTPSLKISELANKTISQNSTTGPIPFTISDTDNPLSSFGVSGSSANSALVPVANIVFGGGGTNRTVTVTPAADQFGTATITVTVTNLAGARASASFVLTVSAGNNLLSISTIPNQTVNPGTPTAALPFTVNGLDKLAGLRGEVSSSNEELVPKSNIVVGGDGTDFKFTVTVTPAGTRTGEATITVKVTTPAGASASVSFLVSVGAGSVLPTVNITASSPNATEPSGPGSFTFTRNGNLSAALVVNYSVSGSAGNGVDFDLLPGSVTIPAGSASVQIAVAPKDDTLVEGNETVIVALASNAAYNPGTPNSATVTIADDDTGSDVLKIISQPTGQTATIGGSVVFNVIAAGGGSLSYQWRKNGAELPGQTGPSLTIINVQDADAGSYSVVVRNNSGSLASAPAALTIAIDAGGNNPPEITKINNQTIDEDTPTPPISFNVFDQETPLAELRLAGSSSNPTLVPNQNIVFSGEGFDRTVVVTPATNQAGTATITVAVSDGSRSASTDFVLTVRPVNDLPTISDTPNQTAVAGSSIGTVLFTVNDTETGASNLVVSGTSSNPNLVPNANIGFGGSGANRTVTVTPLANQNGTTIITLNVTDADGGSVSDSFVLTMLPSQATQPPFTGKLVNGQFQLHWNLPQGQYVLEASANLRDWTPLMTNDLVNGVLDFTDRNASNFSGRFYRAVIRP